MKKFKNALLASGICLSLFMGGCTANAEANVNPTGTDELQVYYIDVGQGDASLLEYKGHFMLIDAGDNDDEKTMVDFLNKKNVKVLDYAVGTHPHADHIGGMDAVIKNFDVKEIYMPKVQSDSKTFEDVLNAIEQKGLSVTAPVVGKKIMLGDIPIEILSPKQAYENTNDNSIALKLVYNKISCLFTGDIEAEAEADILKTGNVTANVLKVAHHGSTTSNTLNFINAVNPQYAIISVGKGNTYGHPHEAILKRLKDKGIQILRTDESGTIVLSTKGDTLAFSGDAKGNNIVPESAVPKTSTTTTVTTTTTTTTTTAPATAAPTAPAPTAPAAPAPTATSYIGNKNSKKFHLPSCTALPIEKNRVALDTKQKALDAGFTPCQNCIGN